MTEIRTLHNVSIAEIHKAFTKAFEDYAEPFALSVGQLENMLDRRAYQKDISFGAFDNGELVGFTLNGVGGWNDHLTAYDTGTGVMQEYRNQGIAKRIFDESIPVLRKSGIGHYLLEVIKTNTHACSLYTKAGFRIVREFDYYVAPKNTVDVNEYAWKYGFAVKEILDPQWSDLQSFWDFKPSWQNSVQAIKRTYNKFTMLGVFNDGNELLGYGVVERATGDIPQFAIAHGHRAKGLAKFLFHHLVTHIEGEQIKIINSDATDAPFKAFATSLGLLPGFGQYEMVLDIPGG